MSGEVDFRHRSQQRTSPLLNQWKPTPHVFFPAWNGSISVVRCKTPTSFPHTRSLLCVHHSMARPPYLIRCSINPSPRVLYRRNLPAVYSPPPTRPSQLNEISEAIRACLPVDAPPATLSSFTQLDSHPLLAEGSNKANDNWMIDRTPSSWE